MTARVATYTRVARVTGRHTTNLDRRRERLNATVARLSSYLPVASYVDVGNAMERPGLARLILDAAYGWFDVVAVESLDDLAGDPAALQAMLAQLAAFGIVVTPLAAPRRERAAGWAAVAFMELLGR